MELGTLTEMIGLAILSKDVYLAIVRHCSQMYTTIVRGSTDIQMRFICFSVFLCVSRELLTNCI